MSKRIRLTRLWLIGAVVAAAFAASQGATAAPAPLVAAQCAPGETTTASWSHLRAYTVEFTWSTGTGTITSTQSVPKGGPPRGELSVPTPDTASSVFVVVTTNDGDRFGAPAPCPI
jgi:hypothetical protein